jgi:hypothetical protein
MPRALRFIFSGHLLVFCWISQVYGQPPAASAAGKNAVLLFNGNSFSGWEGDTLHTWRIENGSITAGSLAQTVPHNDFLVTRQRYSNFILTLKFKLSGTEGFINAGVQFRSQRLQHPSYEMTGYQADIGPHYWASLYDESRRNKTLAAPDSSLIAKILHPGNWNDYKISCENKRIRIYLNEVMTVDYTETDDTIPQEGLIGLQVHGGGKTVIAYKDIRLEVK